MAASTDQFDLYFRRADLDGDGRISGAEAVSFFQGSNLPKHVLAQIWMHADQNRTGFLGRQEFYNALRLVTVAQSKRDLTPDIVKAALFGPAAAKIPAPQINLAAVPGASPGAAAAAPMSQIGMQSSSQQFGFKGQAPSSMGVPSQTVRPPQQMPVTANLGVPSQTLRPAQQMPVTTNMGFPSQTMRPLQQMPANSNMGVPARPNQSVGLPQSSIGAFSQPNQNMRPARPVMANQTLGSQPSMQGTSSMRLQNQGLDRGGNLTGPSTSSFSLSNTWPGGNVVGAPSIQVPTAATKPQDLHMSSSQLTITPKSDGAGNGVQSSSFFGKDSYLAGSPKQVSTKPDPLALLYSSSTTTSSAIVPVTAVPHPPSKARSFDSLQSALTTQPVGSPIHRAQSLTTTNQQLSSQITSSPTLSGVSVGVGGSAAIHGQLTWPKMKPSDVQKYTKVFIEVDSDRDGKITGEQARSLFLSWRLPIEVLKQVWDLSDQDNDSMLSTREFCIALYLMERYREGRPLPSALPSSILSDETLMAVAGRPPASIGIPNWGPPSVVRPQQGLHGSQMPPTAGPRPLLPSSTVHSGGSIQQSEQKPQEVVEEDPFASFGTGKTKSKDNQGAKDAEKKVEVADKAVMDSREKMEFYRTMMQELVLYKSRCDNRLNEITERALADKREAESLGKKYEEKYKQVAELASKLTIEEVKYREVQERKRELQQALVKMEQGGSADGILQVRADRIQSDVDELMKALTERCKKHKLNVTSAALFEMPRGWQPGIQENAAVWDEEWDKFEDEGFSFVNEYNLDKQTNTASPKTKSTSLWEENDSPKSVISDSASNLDATSERPFHTDEHTFDTVSTYDHGNDDFGRNLSETPSGSKAEDEGISFEDSNWGNFDNNDDVDSVWGFNPASSKDFDSESKDDYFFGSGNLNPIRTESPKSDAFPSQSPSVFADSVASTPHSTYVGEVSRGGFFDQSSRFDSFSVRDEMPPRKETFSRFDSMNSTSDFGHHRAFSSFDDSDPFGSTGPFKVSSSETPRKDSKDWNNF